MTLRRALLVCIALAACGSDSSPGADAAGAVDAPPAIDADPAAPDADPAAPDAGSGEITLELAYTQGDADFGRPIVYVAWLENADQSMIQTLYICTRVTDGSLTGTALPFWHVNRYQAGEDYDAVTGATQVNTDFVIARTYAHPTVRQFRVYFEIDHSFDSNDWFDDQPALLYYADVDLDASQTSYPLTVTGWTREELNTFDSAVTSPPDAPVGALQSELRYITNQRDGQVFGDPYTDATPATHLVGGLTLTVIR
jgi:hypothetical protein